MNDSRWGIVIPLTCIIITILLTIIFAPSIFWDVVHHDEDETQYFPSYNDCAPSVCGNSTIRNPFGRCGRVFVDCVDNHTVNFYDIDGGDGPRVMGDFLGTVMGDITESSYSTQTVQIAQHIGHSPQPIFLTAITENGYLFSLSNAYTEGSLYKCTQRPREINENMTWLDWGETHTHYLFYRGSRNINESSINSSCIWYCYLAIPADEKYNISADKNFELLNKKGFQVTWTSYFDGSCEASGGRNYFYSSYCICPNDDVHYSNCSDGQDPIGKITSIGVMAGIFFAGCGLFIIVVVSCIVVRRQNCCCKNTGNEEEQSIRAFMDTLDSRPPSVENFLNYYTSQAPTRYSYTHIMIYTNNLADKVGKGGFGTVYKGKLPSGRLCEDFG